MSEKKRQWLKFSDDVKRKLTLMSVHAGAKSVEEYGGDLLAAEVERLWADFDVKATPKPPAKGAKGK